MRPTVLASTVLTGHRTTETSFTKTCLVGRNCTFYGVTGSIRIPTAKTKKHEVHFHYLPPYPTFGEEMTL